MFEAEDTTSLRRERPGSGWRELAPEPLHPAAELRQRPSFSIVVAAYQAESTIRAALESALDQTTPALEIVVCDDGSTDGTSDILAGFGSTVQTLWQPNGGEAAAKNAATRAARGEFVVVLDADDLFYRHRLEQLGRLAQRRPDLDVLTTDAIVEVDGVPVRRAYHAGWPFPVGDQRLAILERNFVFGLAAVRRRRWLETGGFDETIIGASDWDFWMRLILSGSRAGLVAEPLATYRLTAGTLSADRRRLARARLQVLDQALQRNDLSAEERRVVASSIARERRHLLVYEGEAALPAGGRRARTAFAKIMAGRGFPARTRASAAVAVLSPPLAARYKRRRRRDTIEIGSGLRLAVDPRSRDVSAS